MKNVYFPGEVIFLYSSFQPGLNLITNHQEDLNHIATDNSKYGLYINGQYVTYDQYMRYYSEYLIDTTGEDTYYAYNSYYSNAYLSGYLWTPNYYAHSLEDLNIEDCVIIEQISHQMQCRILHDSDGDIYEDLPWTNMLIMGNNEFYYNYTIPYDLTPGQYQIIYKSIYNKKYYDLISKQYLDDVQLQNLKFDKRNENSIAHTMEMFYIINQSSIYEDTVKITGFVNYKNTTIPAEDVRISIYETNTEINTESKVYQSLTNREGYWEAYLYPNQYKFIFSRNGYNDEVIYTEITDDNNHLLFETISLGNDSISQGTGLFRITDSFTTKTGQPLHNLNITVCDIINPTIIIAEAITDTNGVWELYLDEGFYIFKVNGTLENADFNRVFRLKVLPDGTFMMDNITANILTNSNIPVINNGIGRLKIVDVIQDKWNNPINEVQVNVFYKDDVICEENIRAQDYTDSNGKYIFFLDPGTYVFEYYHPNFNVITELKHINTDGTVTTLEDNVNNQIGNSGSNSNTKFLLQTGSYFYKT